MKNPAAVLLLAFASLSSCVSTAPQPVSAPIKSILRLEDRRTTGPNGELLQFLADSDAAVRARAATAVGRLKFPNGGTQATTKLRALLRDGDESVRACAAFALGMREDPAAYENLVALGVGTKQDHSALVRARAIEAASKLNRAELSEEILAALDDPSADVRIEAAAGTARWKTDALNASAINTRLAAFVAKESDLRVRTYGLFALERRKAKEGRDVCLKSAQSADVDERLFAVRGLANLAGEPEVDAALTLASRDSDWRIAVEAMRGLAKSKAPFSSATFAATLASASHHVRAAALEAIAALGEAVLMAPMRDATFREAFKRLPADKSTSVRVAAMSNSLLRVSLELMGPLQPDASAHVRAAVIKGRAKDRAEESLLDGIEENWLTLEPEGGEKSLLVRGAQIEALAERPDDEATKAMMERLDDADNGLRLAAVTALLEQKWPKFDVAALARCYDTSMGEVSTEVRFNVLKLAAKIGGNEAKKLLERGLEDPDAYVRRTAHDELEKLTGSAIPWTDRALPEVELGFPGEGALANLRPHVVIATSRGEMEFVLFADEAPQHVLNFLKHADFYKGTTFHRVVSDFVAQGGDARGDGNGGSSWRGDALRHEITPRKYVRGSLGMPRNEDWDSGGSQIFVTHRATPHLDGRYTIFGELVKGFDVLDAIDLGDTIDEVRVLR